MSSFTSGFGTAYCDAEKKCQCFTNFSFMNATHRVQLLEFGSGADVNFKQRMHRYFKFFQSDFSISGLINEIKSPLHFINKLDYQLGLQ